MNVTDAKFNYRTGLVEVTLDAPFTGNVDDLVVLSGINSHELQFQVKTPENITDYDPRFDANITPNSIAYDPAGVV